ncbi:transposase [Hymenobacter sp. BT491]|uniref:transposase n=1 Tax=Hymenobacter sp. BT491 TaxID=2766779 RepID=UPI0016535599|nr:transposase [Hymenobacter sp. BT491]
MGSSQRREGNKNSTKPKLPYDPQADPFTCPAGKALPFRTYETTADGALLKIYRAPYRGSQHCPRKATCAPKSKCRQLMRTAYDPAYRRALARQHSRLGQHLRRLRQSRVKPVFGNLLHHYGLRRVGVRGRARAHKVMLVAAAAYNVKKLLYHRPQQALALAVALRTLPVGLARTPFQRRPKPPPARTPRRTFAVAKRGKSSATATPVSKMPHVPRARPRGPGDATGGVASDR